MDVLQAENMKLKPQIRVIQTIVYNLLAQITLLSDDSINESLCLSFLLYHSIHYTSIDGNVNLNRQRNFIQVSKEKHYDL